MAGIYRRRQEFIREGEGVYPMVGVILRIFTKFGGGRLPSRGRLPEDVRYVCLLNKDFELELVAAEN